MKYTINIEHKGGAKEKIRLDNKNLASIVVDGLVNDKTLNIKRIYMTYSDKLKKDTLYSSEEQEVKEEMNEAKCESDHDFWRDREDRGREAKNHTHLRR